VPDYVRVAMFEADDAAIDAMVNEINSAEGPPPDVPAKSIMVGTDRANGKVRVVVRFGSEEDLEKGSAALDAMSPSDTMGNIRRTGVEKFKIELERQAP
jgi:hypothetical protein